MRLLMVRHGQTRANTEMRLAGWTDDPLDETGQRQAEEVARFLADEGDVEAIYASPLQRTRATADAIAAALDIPTVIENPALRERHFGIFENMVFSSIGEQYPEMAEAWNARGAIDWGPPEGELPHEFTGRILDALHDIAARHQGDGRVVVVTHGGVIAVALAAWLNNDPSRWREYFVSNCSISEIEFHSAPRLVRLNACVTPDEVSE
ncbi:MAG: histidine phosphatase family protein [Anaerolineae bacterium]